MKKLYQTEKFKKSQKSRARRTKRKGKLYFQYKINYANPTRKSKSQDKFPITVISPVDLRMMVNTDECVKLVNRIKDVSNYGKQGNYRYLRLSFSKVISIDYSMISVLIAIVGELKNINIHTHIDSKINADIRKYMIESGLFKDFLDEKGKPFYAAKTSSHIFFEKGTGILKREELIKMVTIAQDIHLHLLNTKGYCRRLITILKEVCGNAIEWSGPKKQWLLGIKFESDRVIVTITDLGSGILSTLNSKYSDIFKKLKKEDDGILIGAFDKKYGSKSQKANRNKGLPCVRISHEEKKISALRVLTNNVKLDFDNNSKNKVLSEFSNFYGTQYRFEITSENLN